MKRFVFIWLRRAALALLVAAGGPLASAPAQGPPPTPLAPPPGLGPPTPVPVIANPGPTNVAPMAPVQPPAPAQPAPAQPATPAPVAGPLSFIRNVPGEAKAIILSADEVASWSEPGRNVILLHGQVLIQQGYVQVRALARWSGST